MKSPFCWISDAATDLIMAVSSVYSSEPVCTIDKKVLFFFFLLFFTEKKKDTSRLNSTFDDYISIKAEWQVFRFLKG